MTLIHERADGVKVEFRRVHRLGREGILDLEHRELRTDGYPHNDNWYPVSDWLLLRMQQIGSDIVEALAIAG